MRRLAFILILLIWPMAAGALEAADVESLRDNVVNDGRHADPVNTSWADEYCEGAYDSGVCGRPLFEQNIVHPEGTSSQASLLRARDALGRARSVKSFWGNPETGPIANRAGPWRGYNFDAEGRLSAVFEQQGVVEPVGADPIGDHSVTNQDVLNLVDQYASSPEPILAVDWLRERKVGGLQQIVEQGGATRWSQTGNGPNGARNAGHQLGSVSLDGSSYAIEHDEQGRVTEGAGASFDYSIRGRLLRSDRGGIAEQYLYDADGRLAAIINGKTRYVVYDGEQMIAGMDQTGTTRWEVVPGAFTDQILEYSSEVGDRLIPITDHRNSAVGWWNAETRQMQHVIEYTPHGRVRLYAPDGTPRCEEEGTGNDCVRSWSLPQFGFASLYRSERTGITYMRNRWYAPKLGQFLSHDPLGYVDSYNLYAYAAHDPINFWDPYGLGSRGFSNDPIESSFVEGGFGNDNAQCPGCFDTSSSDPTRAVAAVRGAADKTERGAQVVGDSSRRATDNARDFYYGGIQTCVGISCLGFHAGALGTELYAGVAPQSKDDVLLDAAITIGTLGLGKAAGALDDAVDVIRSRDATDEAVDTFRILDGVRRSKATELAQLSDEVAAVIERVGQPDEFVSLPLDSLLSPKELIDISAQKVPGQLKTQFARFMELFDAAKAGKIRDPIRVTPSKTGVPLRDVRLGIPDE